MPPRGGGIRPGGIRPGRSLPSRYFSEGPYWFVPRWLSSQKKMMRRMGPASGMRFSRRSAPLLLVSCRRLHPTAREGSSVESAHNSTGLSPARIWLKTLEGGICWGSLKIKRFSINARLSIHKRMKIAVCPNVQYQNSDKVARPEKRAYLRKTLLTAVTRL